MRIIKIIASRIIWHFCKLNWRIGDFIMNLIGRDNYLNMIYTSYKRLKK